MEQIIVCEGQRMTSATLIADISIHYDIFIIHLDCDTTTAAERVRVRGGREPYKDIFLTRVASAINNVRKSTPADRFLTVDGTGDRVTVAGAIKSIMMERLTR